MTAEGQAKSSAEELARAREEIRSAETLLAAGSPRVAATRVYYALFHAVRALLYRKNLEPKSHAGVQSLFDLNFIRAGLFRAEDGRLLRELERFREEADYGDTFVGDEAKVRADLDSARELIGRIESAVG